MTECRTGRDVNQELPQVMTVEELARYLRVSKRTVYSMAQAGTLPAAKVGDRWRFYRPEIERWLTKLSRANVGDTTPVDPESPAPTVKL